MRAAAVGGWAGMAGGSPRHAALSGAILSELRVLARPRGCTVFSSDLRVRSEETDFVSYPDVTVVCGELRNAENDPHAVINPKVVVEVLSSSTEAYDRGAKSTHYRHIPSLEEIVFVSQGEELIEVHRKNERGRWELAVEARRGERVEIASLGGDFAVDDVYEGVPAS